MKNCDEMVNSLLKRRDQYEEERKNRRKMFIRTITPLCCMCLAVLLGVGAWQGGRFEKRPISNEQKVESHDISDTKIKRVISSFGESYYSAEYTYATPENGKIHFSVPLDRAMDEYGNDVVYRVVMDIFCEKNQLSVDNEQIDEEIKRLSDDGYNVCKENINGTLYIIIDAELGQLEAFSVSENYGYFMFLYAERIDATAWYGNKITQE